MENSALSRQLQKLQGLIQRTRQASSDDLELQAHWGRYLCVLVAGFVENALVEIYSDFVQNASSSPVAKFASSHLSRIQNPKAERFLEIAGSFKSSWVNELKNFLNEEGRKDAIDSIMANRHLIAHGQSAGITVARVSEYLVKCIEVIDFIESQCRGQ